MIKVLIHTITIGQFRSTSKEVKSGLHYLNENFMNFVKTKIVDLIHNFLNNIKNILIKFNYKSFKDLKIHYTYFPKQ